MYWFIVYYQLVGVRGSSEEVLVCQCKFEKFMPKPVEEALSKKIDAKVSLTAFDLAKAEDLGNSRILRIYLNSNELKNA